MTPKKPMLACKGAPRFPMLASAKLDGIRCTTWPEQPLTRALKSIPNVHIRETIKAAQLPAVFDGELVVGPANAADVYTQTTSGVMAHGGQPDFSFWAFDWIPAEGLDASLAFSLRYARLDGATSSIRAFHPWFKVLPHAWVNNEAELDAFEAQCLIDGFEGVILRSPDGVYKHGRSTADEQGMLKVKRFEDTELLVLGAVEMMHNDNEATINELGHTQRSTAKGGKRPAGVLGALVCRWRDTTVEVGTGFTAAHRASFWELHLAGKLPQYAKVKYFAHGMVDKPRHPVFLGWRGIEDM